MNLLAFGDPALPTIGAACFTFSTYGVRISIQAPDAETLSRLAARVPPNWAPSAAPVVERSYVLVDHGNGEGGDGVELIADGHSLVRGCDFDRLCAYFEADLQLFVAEMAQPFVFVHAGAVGWRGQAIIVPGRSGSGKTTLIAELVRAGATYYSDEYAVLDGNGRVHAYPTPLSVRHQDGHARKVPVETLGGREGTEPLPVGFVLACEYQPAAMFSPRLLSPGNATLALLAHTVSARRQPEAALAALNRVVMRATVLEGERGDAQSTVELIMKIVNGNSWRMP